MTKTITTTTTEIKIPLYVVESPLLPWPFPCIEPLPPLLRPLLPPLQSHAMVSSTQKPKALDNQDEEDDDEAGAEDENINSNIPNTITSRNSTNSIDYPVLISDRVL